MRVVLIRLRLGKVLHGAIRHELLRQCVFGGAFLPPLAFRNSRTLSADDPTAPTARDSSASLTPNACAQ
jgi:hypothetical protein